MTDGKKRRAPRRPIPADAIDETDEAPSRSAPVDPIDRLISMQQDMIRSWSELVVRSVYRWQSGNLDLKPWFEVYSKLTGETADEALDVLRRLYRLRGSNGG